ncbi:MAG: hypothetical protein AAGI70_06390 [Pseudomonadota bacterium]
MTDRQTGISGFSIVAEDADNDQAFDQDLLIRFPWRQPDPNADTDPTVEFFGATSDTPVGRAILRCEEVNGSNTNFHGIDDVTLGSVAVIPLPAGLRASALKR